MTIWTYSSMFEGIAKTNTTHTERDLAFADGEFEGIAKTNTTHTRSLCRRVEKRLRVLLKQIQHTHATC